VVFPRQVLKETYADPRITEAQKQLSMGLLPGQKDFDEIFQQVYSEKQTGLARCFDNIHSVDRAKKVGSIDDIIKPSELRPYLAEHLRKAYQTDTDGKKEDSPDFTYG
jgi:acetyl-CoA carboxylase carboxyltransferase component